MKATLRSKNRVVLLSTRQALGLRFFLPFGPFNHPSPFDVGVTIPRPPVEPMRVLPRTSYYL
jgi:hypothetical protein